jgi:acetylornithine deacetylase
MKRIDPNELLKRLVGIPSVSGDEAAVAEAVCRWAEARGLSVKMAGRNVVIRVGAAGGKRLLLNSHLDTVTPTAGWQTDPYRPEEDGGRIMGLGANDAKGCVTAMLCAVAQLSGAALAGEVVLALTVDEETGTTGDGLQGLLPQLGELDAAVIGEPTGLDVCNAQKGLLILNVETSGDARHAAHAHRIEGTNAVLEAARAILKLEDWSPVSDARGNHLVTCHVTTISGGTSRNVIPDGCAFTLDIRTLPGIATEQIVSAVAQRTGARVTVHSDRLQPFATRVAADIVRAARRARPEAVLVTSDTMSDAVWTRHVPTIKVGPGRTDRSHRAGEFITTDELAEGVAFYTRLVEEFFSPHWEA